MPDHDSHQNHNSPLSNEEPLGLAPGQDDDELPRSRPRKTPEPIATNEDTKMESRSGIAMQTATGEALRWALDALHSPAIAAADWLARDIDPDVDGAATLLCNPKITMTQVRQAKTVYKTMRIVGEKSSDRRIGARLYAAAIAAGLVRHGKKVTTQSDKALRRAFTGLLEDRRLAQPLRDLAGMALCAMDNPTSGSAQPDLE